MIIRSHDSGFRPQGIQCRLIGQLKEILVIGKKAIASGTSFAPTI
jgi:hypothetical protein